MGLFCVLSHKMLHVCRRQIFSVCDIGLSHKFVPGSRPRPGGVCDTPLIRPDTVERMDGGKGKAGWLPCRLLRPPFRSERESRRRNVTRVRARADRRRNVLCYGKGLALVRRAPAGLSKRLLPVSANTEASRSDCVSRSNQLRRSARNAQLSPIAQ